MKKIIKFILFTLILVILQSVLDFIFGINLNIISNIIYKLGTYIIGSVLFYINYSFVWKRIYEYMKEHYKVFTIEVNFEKKLKKEIKK